MDLWSNKSKTNFSTVNNPLCSKINHFLQLHTQPGSWKNHSIYYEFDCFFKKENKSNNRKNSGLPIQIPGDQRGLMGGSQYCGWVPKVAPLGCLKLVGKRRACWAPLPQKSCGLRVWRCDCTNKRPVQTMISPSQITAAYSTLLLWWFCQENPHLAAVPS